MGTKIKTCVIVGASPAADSAFMRPFFDQADCIICADGGLLHLQNAGVAPHLLVGDFDSLQQAANIPPQTQVLPLPVHKDDTDLLVAVQEGFARGCTNFVILGALGARADHTYGNFCILQYIAQQGGSATLQDRGTQISLLLAGQTKTLSGVLGHTVSVFPFGCPSCTLTYHGLEYPLDHGTLVSHIPLGVSNVAVESTIEITCHSGSALVMALSPQTV